MIISHTKKFVFFHLYKVAGTSISNALGTYADISTYSDEPHIHPALMKERKYGGYQGKELLEDYFTFAFVRNPWDWEVSLHSFMVQTSHPTITSNPSLLEFDKYIRYACGDDWYGSTSPFVDSPQYRFLSDDNDLTSPISLNFIGKFEHLHSDLTKICQILGLQCTLLHLNNSIHAKYIRYYTNETKQLVANKHHQDIEYFGYSFGNNNTPHGKSQGHWKYKSNQYRKLAKVLKRI